MLTKYLKKLVEEKDFNLVLNPRSGIEPLDLLFVEKNKLTRQGNLLDNSIYYLLNESERMLPTTREVEHGNILNRRVKGWSGEMKAKINTFSWTTILNFFKEEDKATAEIGLDALNEQGIQLDYKNTTIKEVENLLDLDSFIRNAKLNAGLSQQVREKIFNSELYVIISTLKSREILTRKESNNNSQVAGNVNVKNIANVSAEVGMDKGNTEALTYQGKEDIIFGIQAVRLIYKNRRYIGRELVTEEVMRSSSPLLKLEGGIGEFV